MEDLITIEYEHKCGCARQGSTMSVRPDCRDGAALIVRPTCIETGVELVEIARHDVSWAGTTPYGESIVVIDEG
jgi:hypothetical protein